MGNTMVGLHNVSHSGSRCVGRGCWYHWVGKEKRTLESGRKEKEIKKYVHSHLKTASLWTGKKNEEENSKL
jgi:hypothetical protein